MTTVIAAKDKLRKAPAGIPMRSTLPSSSRGSKREALVRCARAELAAHGFDGTHLSVLSARVGIRKSSFFHYFPDKESLYDVAVGSLFDDVADAVDLALVATPTFGEQIDRLVECLCRCLRGEPLLGRLILRAFVDAPPFGTQRPTGLDRLAARIAEIITLGVSEGVVARGDAGREALDVLSILSVAQAPQSLSISLRQVQETIELTAEMRFLQARAQVQRLLSVAA